MMEKTAVVFAYNNIGCIGIKALLEAGFKILAVFTHKDDPQEQLWFASVAELCAVQGLPVYAPENVNEENWIAFIGKLKPDFIFSFYYRNMLSSDILKLAKEGALNLHGSLLPKFRGRAPVNWAIIKGEKETGATLHYMTEKPDAGEIVAQRAFTIENEDTAHTVALNLSKEAACVLKESLPLLLAGKAKSVPQDLSMGSYYGGRRPEDGYIDWSKGAEEIHNLVRAVTKPWPGAFTYFHGDKYYVWSCRVVENTSRASAGSIVSVKPLVVACGEGAIEVLTAQKDNDILYSGEALAVAKGFTAGSVFDGFAVIDNKKTKVLVVGANGFIGNALCKRLLSLKSYEVYALDIHSNNYDECMADSNFHYRIGDMAKERAWLDHMISCVDVVIPLAAIATPIEYTRNPLRIFELDFEENLHIVRTCFKYGKRIIFPSTSEVYAMCTDEAFDEDNSSLVLGPIAKKRWIYSCSKQMLDRVIWAYGEKGLQFTLIRPFNWIGPKLDSLENAKTSNARVITQMLMNLCEGRAIQLVDGGAQKRCFTALEDGIDCLVKIIENKQKLCDGKIINIGNPANEYSIKELAELTIKAFVKNPLHVYFPKVQPLEIIAGDDFYGKGYQDVIRRCPKIENAKRYCDWEPIIGMEEAVQRVVDYYVKQAISQGIGKRR